jgi:choline/ethanolamine phosphotransferase
MSAQRNSDKNLTSTFRNNVRQLSERTQRLETNARAALRRLPVVLNEQEIRRLREHKYESEGITLLDPFMQKYWKWLLQFCPLWVAPNLITIFGLAINIGTSILLMLFTNGAKEQCTGWMYFFTALGLFIYQSLDAIDGKQARRTNTSSPLGELFDHGCDSVSAVFVTVACCCAVQLGLHPWLMFWCCMFAYIGFYCAHWQTYVSGKLRFGILDCTEAQFSFLVVYTISIISPGFWAKTIPLLNIECRVLGALLMLGSTVWSAGNNIHTISQGGCGRNYSSVAGTSIIFPGWPIGFLIFLAYIASSYSISNALQNHPALLLVCYGIVFSKITNRLIVAHMSKSVLNAWDTGYIGPIAVCINQYFNCFIGEHIFLWLFLTYNLYDLLRYNVKVCQELCDALDIHCFRIKPTTPPTVDRSH